MKMTREDALKFIMQMYPGQSEIWSDYLREVERIFPNKDLILLSVSGESE